MIARHKTRTVATAKKKGAGSAMGTDDWRRVARLAQRLLSAIPPWAARTLGHELMMDRNPKADRYIGRFLYDRYRQAYRKGEVGGHPMDRDDLRQLRREARLLLNDIRQQPRPKVCASGPPVPGYLKELVVRYRLRRIPRGEFFVGETLRTSRDTFRLFSWLRYEPREHLFVVHVSRGNQLLSVSLASIGTATEAPCNPAEVFRDAMFAGAAGVIFIHNHPSGQPIPSNGDHAMMRELCQTGKFLRIPVMDFVVIGDRDYWSASDRMVVWNGEYRLAGQPPTPAATQQPHPARAAQRSRRAS